jgi:hypothetical protein
VHEQTGNLSPSERSISAVAGAVSLIAATQVPLVWRGILALGGLGLIARAAAGHCAVKSALRGDATLRQSVSDQWARLQPSNARVAARCADGLPGSPRHQQKSQAVDESVEESFPASDPPASRLPDEPPVNAEAKWRAAAAAANGGD